MFEIYIQYFIDQVLSQLYMCMVESSCLAPHIVEGFVKLFKIIASDYMQDLLKHHIDLNG